jgi:DNA primase
MSIPSQSLYALRNEIKIENVIKNILKIDHKYRDNHLRFLCPCCRDFNTAINQKTNLARCFRCKKNFNPIDMTMEVRKWDFRTTVKFLTVILCSSA